MKQLFPWKCAGIMFNITVNQAGTEPIGPSKISMNKMHASIRSTEGRCLVYGKLIMVNC